jgi:4-phosphopantoate---beta-alanine ligase
MQKIHPKHPRYQSLILREKMAQAYKQGILADTALIAHGRGEAFDYILGEKTTIPAIKAIQTAAACLILAKNPVISVNGNTAVLASQEVTDLARILKAKLEINLYYRTHQRVMKVEQLLKIAGAQEVLGSDEDDYVLINGLEGPRSRASPEGIHKADVVLVPLEDGDRVEALTAIGKKIIAIDLNPLSRTSKNATISIVDNVVRALPLLKLEIEKLKECESHLLEDVVNEFDNHKNLQESLWIVQQGYVKDVEL